MKNFPNWTRVGKTMAKVPLASGYRFELLQDHEIPALPAAVKAWFPEISVGSASCYLREDFFRDHVYLPGGPEKDVLVVLIKKETELAGLFSCERDLNTLSLYAKLGVLHLASRSRSQSRDPLARRSDWTRCWNGNDLRNGHAQDSSCAAGLRDTWLAADRDHSWLRPGNGCSRCREAGLRSHLRQSPRRRKRPLASARTKSDPKDSRVLSDAVPPQARAADLI